MNKKELFNPISYETAQKFLESKKTTETFLKSKAIAELWDDEAKSQAFFSATVAKADLLEGFQYRVNQIVAGEMEAGQATQWMRDFLNTDGENALSELGYLPSKYLSEEAEGDVSQLGSQRRIKLILEQNTRMALSTGEYAAAIDNDVDYLRYKTKEDSRVRPSHALLDNKVWAIDDPVWKEIYPPNSYGCRCYVEQIKAGVMDDTNINLQPEGKLPDAIKNGSQPLDTSGYSFDVTQGIGQARDVKENWSDLLKEKYKDEVIPFMKSENDFLNKRKVFWTKELAKSAGIDAEVCKDTIKRIDKRIASNSTFTAGKTIFEKVISNVKSVFEDLFNKNMKTVLAELATNTFKNAPDDIKEIVKKTIIYCPVVSGEETYFSSFPRKIFISSGNKKYPYALAHEYGHYVDNKASGSFLKTISTREDLAIGKELRDHIEAVIGIFTDNTEAGLAKSKEIYFGIAQKIDLGNEEYAKIMDLINGFSKGAYRFSLPTTSHTAGYWRQKGMIQNETFANLFSLRTMQNLPSSQEQIAILNEYFPGLWDSFLLCLKQINDKL